ncbi:MAG: recombinase family protein [Acidobacteriia bacterium]|nr:recombinase family protein [Terriglobia bacterium]
MRKRVIELVRVSTESQAGKDRAGIPAQKEANRQTAIRYDLEIVRTIEISDVSGAAVLRSPEMQNLLKLIESSEVHGVVAKEFSRLMRPENFADFALLQSFADTDTVLYLPEGPIDFSSKSGRLFGTLRAAMAGAEKVEIAERVWGAKEEKRRAGKHPQSEIALPFGVGFERGKDRWFFKPEAEKVRAAFRFFLSGETSYTEVGRKVGIAPFNLRNILRNPIYTGWRVYTKRRDPSAKAMRVRADGRQGDRPKIQRSNSEIIRVKVLDPLIDEQDFHRVQQILNLKKENHWRVRPDHQRRFTYSGFLRCGICGNLIYTHAHNPRDWYVCKSRTFPARSLRLARGLPPCTNPYMRRERVESLLDSIFSQRLTDHDFLERIATDFAEMSHSTENKDEHLRLQRMCKQLLEKRARVLDAFFENLIDRKQRDEKLKEVDVDLRFCEQKLRDTGTDEYEISAESLAIALAPFQEWEFLPRKDKRRLLQSLIPEIHIQNYEVTKLAWLAAETHGYEKNHTGTDSWPRPA